MSAVEISSIRKSYGATVALSDINISIPSGSFFTLLGPSGCGKTTLLRTIAGFHQQDSGRIAIAGQQIENVPAHKRDVGMVFQDYAVFPHISVADNIAFGLKQRKVSRGDVERRVADILDVVQLKPYAARMPHELSGGQQQRVGLARALVINPQVLLMDEPLSNLDAKLRVDLRRELRAIQQSMNITTVYVTHDQEEALAMSDFVCVMYGGVIQQAAAPWEVYNSPANRFVASFVGANNFMALSINGTQAAIAGTAVVLPQLAGLATGKQLVAAVRPEFIAVNAAAGDDLLRLPVKIRQVSFTGREMAVAAVLASGEEIEAITKPTPDIIALHPNDDATFAFAAGSVQLFEEGVTGARVF
ncbi:ABC transporter ATP-binding protein [Neorhizobium galegae]|uniref:ABC transporter ATP-binding protein n=1 Tax=Neorhizobium galegae TaxID=399 RepID=UPI001355D54E|nr:ABC transporter ATP-binding protein [Neorhizobium galegae]KAB1115050.1 ABC transporter ATP-binding protein [Neorhizobium galegae]MCQ1774401.1 ABC transporter ATP-binding protein [Neorhizobium galegae]MCQ1798941.1 ABC transporter ATP-binding protein [Neorhizobium galegae]